MSAQAIFSSRLQFDRCLGAASDEKRGAMPVPGSRSTAPAALAEALLQEAFHREGGGRRHALAVVLRFAPLLASVLGGWLHGMGGPLAAGDSPAASSSAPPSLLARPRKAPVRTDLDSTALGKAKHLAARSAMPSVSAGGGLGRHGIQASWLPRSGGEAAHRTKVSAYAVFHHDVAALAAHHPNDVKMALNMIGQLPLSWLQWYDHEVLTFPIMTKAATSGVC
jgi:hypothetical protein